MDRKIMLMKLVNGIDCIGEVKQEVMSKDGSEPVGFVFKKLKSLVYQTVPGTSNINIGFQAFLLPAEDADLTIAFEDILTAIDAPKKIEEGYLQATSGLTLASSLPRGGNVIEGRIG